MRELVNLTKEEQVEVWKKATENTAQPTAAEVRLAKEQVLQKAPLAGSSEAPPKKRPFRFPDELNQLEVVLYKVQKRCPSHRWREFCGEIRTIVFRHTWEVDRKKTREGNADGAPAHADLDAFLRTKTKD